MVETGRDVTVDIVRALGIFCMVAGHCGFPFTHFIYLFHMAVFFMISGFCFNECNSQSIKNTIAFIKRKFITLWYPFVLWETIYSLLHNFFIKINVYTDNPLILDYVGGEYIKTTPYWSRIDMTKNIIKAFFFHGGTQLGGGLWFLAILMQISVIYCIIDCALKKTNLPIFVAQWIVSGAFLMIGFVCMKTGCTLAGMDRMFSYYILFHGGYTIRKYNLINKNKMVLTHLIILICSLGVLLFCNSLGSISLSNNSYNDPVFLLVTSFSGYQFLFEIAFFIRKIECVASVLSCIGLNTLAIVVLHFLSFKIVNYIGTMFKHQPMCLVAAFPVLYTGKGWWIAYCAVGMSVPICLNLWWRKQKARIKKSRYFTQMSCLWNND